jgi:hypothetical protein
MKTNFKNILSQHMPWWVLLGAFVLLVIIVGVLLHIKIERGNYYQTYRELQKISLLFKEKGYFHDSLPGPSFVDALKQVSSISERKEELSHFRMLPYFQRNQDPWGNPMIYVLAPDKHAATIRSIGPNHRDEEGKGDDIQVTIDVRTLKGFGNEAESKTKRPLSPK